jgi:hypothetical protein
MNFLLFFLTLKKGLPIVYIIDKNANLFDQLLVQQCLHMNNLRVTNIFSDISKSMLNSSIIKFDIFFFNFYY